MSAEYLYEIELSNTQDCTHAGLLNMVEALRKDRFRISLENCPLLPGSVFRFLTKGTFSSSDTSALHTQIVTVVHKYCPTTVTVTTKWHEVQHNVWWDVEYKTKTTLRPYQA